MRLFFLFVISLTVSGFLQAHEISGSVEVILKREKKKNDLSGVVVYLEESAGRTGTFTDLKEKNYEIVTRNKQFTPRILVIPVGARVRFPNNDPIFHNIFSVAPRFDLGFSRGGETKEYLFQSSGIVKVFCNVHPQMSATIVVVETPYFTYADKDGNFLLRQVPAGSYTLRAYTEEGQTEQKITVGENPMSLKLTIDGRNFKKVQHKNKFGKDYSREENEKY